MPKTWLWQKTGDKRAGIVLLALVWHLSLVSAFAVQAQLPPWQHELTVDVEGNLEYPTCTPNLQRKLVPVSGVVTSNSVKLPDIYTNDLMSTGTKTGVTVTFQASGCTGNQNHMWVHFTSASVDAGRIVPKIGNTSTGSSTLRFEIRDNNTSGALITVGGSASAQPNSNQGTATPFSGSYPADHNRTANKSYGISYYVKSSGTPANTYKAQVTANFKYY